LQSYAQESKCLLQSFYSRSTLTKQLEGIDYSVDPIPIAAEAAAFSAIVATTRTFVKFFPSTLTELNTLS
jgi:hypothetical protein